jgi:hypothetical protein
LKEVREMGRRKMDRRIHWDSPPAQREYWKQFKLGGKPAGKREVRKIWTIVKREVGCSWKMPPTYLNPKTKGRGWRWKVTLPLDCSVGLVVHEFLHGAGMMKHTIAMARMEYRITKMLGAKPGYWALKRSGLAEEGEESESYRGPKGTRDQDLFKQVKRVPEKARLSWTIEGTDPETGREIVAHSYNGVPDYYGHSTSWIETKIAGVTVVVSFKKTYRGAGMRSRAWIDLKKRMKEGIEIYHGRGAERRYSFKVNEDGIVERNILKEIGED